MGRGSLAEMSPWGGHFRSESLWTNFQGTHFGISVQTASFTSKKNGKYSHLILRCSQEISNLPTLQNNSKMETWSDKTQNIVTQIGHIQIQLNSVLRNYFKLPRQRTNSEWIVVRCRLLFTNGGISKLWIFWIFHFREHLKTCSNLSLHFYNL